MQSFQSEIVFVAPTKQKLVHRALEQSCAGPWQVRAIRRWGLQTGRFRISFGSVDDIPAFLGYWRAA